MENGATASSSRWGLFSPEAFPEAEQLLTAFFSASTVGLCILDNQLRFQVVNHALSVMDGLSAEAHTGKTVLEILGNMDGLELALQRALASGGPVLDLQLSGQLPNKAEVVHWIGNCFPIKDCLGNTTQMCAAVVYTNKT